MATAPVMGSLLAAARKEFEGSLPPLPLLVVQPSCQYDHILCLGTMGESAPVLVRS